MGNMAGAMGTAGLAMQYCMPLPRHYLQSTLYDGAVPTGETIRGVSFLPVGQTPIAGAAVASSHLRVDVFDLQGTCTWESAFWTHLVGFGVRFSSMSQDYQATLDEVLAKLSPENHHLAIGLAVIPEKIRGFGHVKHQHLAAAKADEAALLEQFRAGAPMLLKAAE